MRLETVQRLLRWDYNEAALKEYIPSLYSV